MRIIEKTNNEIAAQLKNNNNNWIEVFSIKHTSGLNLPFEYNPKGFTLLTVKTVHKDIQYTDCFYFSVTTGKLVFREINNIFDVELSSEYEFLIADNQRLDVFIRDLVLDWFLTRPQFRYVKSNFDLSSLQQIYWLFNLNKATQTRIS